MLTQDRLLSDIHHDLIAEVRQLDKLAPQENLSVPMQVACEQVAAAAAELGGAVQLLSFFDGGRDVLGAIDQFRRDLERETGDAIDRQTAVCVLLDFALSHANLVEEVVQQRS